MIHSIFTFLYKNRPEIWKKYEEDMRVKHARMEYDLKKELDTKLDLYEKKTKAEILELKLKIEIPRLPLVTVIMVRLIVGTRIYLADVATAPNP